MKSFFQLVSPNNMNSIITKSKTTHLFLFHDGGPYHAK